jgi:hypothetical protein
MIEAGSCGGVSGEERAEKTSHGTVGRLGAAIVRPLRIFVAMMREVFDESAYQRFLERGQMESSANAYALFRRENELARSRRPRCC